jgi:peptidyl-prolyl cis-trans isomerase C
MMIHSQKPTAGAVARALIVALAALPIGAQSWAQTAPADPVVATVAGEPIRLSDVRDAMAGLPAQAQQMPPQTVFPYVLDQIVDARILVQAARKAGLDKDPAVQRQMAAASERVLQTAILHREIDPLLTDAALKTRFDKDNAGKAGEEEVHARHILVEDEATAKKVTAELKKGGDFAALSKQYSKDPGASAQGGDLGFFKKGDMVPEFSVAAFALKDGQITDAPVKTQFGYHIIQRIERRVAAPPSFEESRDELRQKVVQETVQAAVAKARVGVTVEKFNMDGSARKATDLAEPPPAK